MAYIYRAIFPIFTSHLMICNAMTQDKAQKKKMGLTKFNILLYLYVQQQMANVFAIAIVLILHHCQIFHLHNIYSYGLELLYAILLLCAAWCVITGYFLVLCTLKGNFPNTTEYIGYIDKKLQEIGDCHSAYINQQPTIFGFTLSCLCANGSTRLAFFSLQ